MYPKNFDVLIIYITNYLLLFWLFVTLDIPIAEMGEQKRILHCWFRLLDPLTENTPAKCLTDNIY